MEMSVWDHLDELRSRLIRIVIALSITTTLAFFGSDWMLACLLKPFPSVHATLTSLQPAGVFMQSMRLALIGGVVLALPVLVYQIWQFISPGLAPREIKAFVMSLYFGTFLFLIGVCFAYFLVVPKALGFFWDYSRNLGVTPSWTIENYLNFVLMFLLSFGIAFELPLVLILLVRFKIISPTFISSKRPHIIVALAIVAAILTPPDVISQLMLGIPLWLLFEISLYVSKLMYKE
ncbi:MAG: twin arginine-targeting protein translocase TatC [Deltaproteobacteria bacterium RIFCSPLOWO2_02_FULL_46_8]|nr:MAG: twin arginine-targeting protein translocase TatC [Deltaproteobacteria bacterium RIFCSPLOWO2_02_FULL_46_8]